MINSRCVLTLAFLALVPAAHALTLPAAFSMEVGQRVDLRTLTASDATFTSSDPAVVSIESGRFAVVKHLTGDGTPLTITATGGGSTVTARVSTHGIEYAVGQIKSFGNSNSVESQLLVVRARLAGDITPDGIGLAFAFGNADINKFPLGPVPARALSAVGKMKVFASTFPLNEVYTFRVRAGNIERTIRLPTLSGYSGPTSSFTAGVQATFQNGNFSATGPAQVAPRSFSLRLVPAIGGLEGAVDAALPSLRFPLSATLQGLTGGMYNVSLRAFDSPVLDPKIVLPDRANATQQFLLSTTVR
ncbi:hypothetical protein DESA109040_11400 [Deinococcus saxicola]|uniref:hypothetical protein n=1 Tax=Deinococcus saxicola TaxID=249406 RepID=UPI0039F0D528